MDAQNLLIHDFFDKAVVNDFARDYLFRVTALKFDGLNGADLALNELLYVLYSLHETTAEISG